MALLRLTADFRTHAVIPECLVAAGPRLRHRHCQMVSSETATQAVAAVVNMADRYRSPKRKGARATRRNGAWEPTPRERGWKSSAFTIALMDV